MAERQLLERVLIVMKREHSIEQSYIDWLKSIGCLVWLPLHGDLQDKISGLYLQPTGSGSLQYDSGVDMYRLKSPSTYGGTSNTSYVAFLENSLSSADFPTDCYTVCSKNKRISTSGVCTSFGLISGNYSYAGEFSASYNMTQGLQSWPNTSFDFGAVVNHLNQTRQYYQNCTLYGSYAEASSILPSNWVATRNGMCLGYAYDYSRTNKECYISDFYLFNTALDLTTIRKIQGYE